MSEHLPKTSPFLWTHARAEAAVLVAEDAVTDEEIAATVGVSRRTLTTWKQHPAFRERVAEKVAELDAAVSRFVIAKRRERVRIRDEQLAKLLTVQEERAAAYQGQAPGGGTGTQVRQLKVIGTGDSQQVIEEWVTDTGMQSEMRSLMKEAAQELGQWSEKSTVNHSGGIRREIVVISDPDTGPIDVTDEASFGDIEADLAQLRDEHPEDAL